MKKSLLLLFLILPASAFAEDDGEEFLSLMQSPPTREAALAHIFDVVARWDGGAFCLVKGNALAPSDPADAAFAAVKAYLEEHAEDRYRPRRYLIIQALRESFPCPRL